MNERLSSEVPSRVIPDIHATVDGLSDRSPILLSLVAISNPNVFTFVGALAALLLGWSPDLSMRTTLLVLVGGYVVIFGLLVLATGEQVDSVVLLQRPSVESVLAVGLGVAWLIGASTVLLPGGLESVFGTGTAAGAPPLFVLQLFVVLVVVIPLMEELVFRGLLFGYVLDARNSVVLAAVVTMVAFGVSHFEYGFAGILTRTVASTVYVAQRVRYDSLTESFLTHAGFNTVVFAGLVGLT